MLATAAISTVLIAVAPENKPPGNIVSGSGGAVSDSRLAALPGCEAATGSLFSASILVAGCSAAGAVTARERLAARLLFVGRCEVVDDAGLSALASAMSDFFFWGMFTTKSCCDYPAMLSV
ncbi:MAG: hypothetical protein WB697_11850 [Stellaceae bacterium]